MRKAEARSFLYILVGSTTVFIMMLTYKAGLMVERKSPEGGMYLPWNRRLAQQSPSLPLNPCSDQLGSQASLPVIYVITPTYPRPTQIPELVRFAQTLMTVPKVFWIVVEDAPLLSIRVATYLNSTGLPHTYIAGKFEVNEQ